MFDTPISPKRRSRILSPTSYLRSGKQVKVHVAEQEQWHFSSQFALASTCRSIYIEVAPIYYGMNRFVANDRFGSFLDAIGPKNVKCIRSLIWSQRIDPLIPAFPQLDNLRRLSVPICCLRSIVGPKDMHCPRQLLALNHTKPAVQMVVADYDPFHCERCFRSQWDKDERVGEFASRFALDRLA